MAKNRRLIKKGSMAVIVSIGTALHPDDRKFIKDKVLVDKDHLVYVDADDPVYLHHVCDDLATFSKVVIDNPQGKWQGQFILGRLGFLSGLNTMGHDMYITKYTEIYLSVYELSNTNDLVCCDVHRLT